MTKTPILLAAAGLITLTACVDPNAYPDDPNARTKSGAVIGGLLGAAAGVAASGDGDELKGALIGGAVGAGTGALIGADLDRQAAELRGSLSSNISVTNHGDYLVVNMPQDLLFATDSASLRPDLTSDIRTVAASLLKYPNSRIEVIGHTDNLPIRVRFASNWELSAARAIAAVRYLTEKAGVDPRLLSAVGSGEFQPIADNATAEGRARNRRIAVVVLPEVFAGGDTRPGPVAEAPSRGAEAAAPPSGVAPPAEAEGTTIPLSESPGGDGEPVPEAVAPLTEAPRPPE